MAKMTTGQAIARSLQIHGVDTIFGIPGAHMYDFNDALFELKDDISFYTTRHEQGAGYMAYGYAKSTGRVGTYTVVPGPGVLNSGAALCTAYGATTPLLCVTGNIMSNLIGKGRGQLHELPDQLATLRSITKWSERIRCPQDAPKIVAEAFNQLLSGRPQPVTIEAPWDVFGMSAEVDLAVDIEPTPPPTPNQSDLQAAVKLIKQANNPMISVGAGALHAGQSIAQLAQRLQAPVSSHRSGKGIVSDDSPYAMNLVAARRLWEETDLLIGIGSRLELQHFRWRWFPPGIKIIRIDIDPEEFKRIPMDVGILTDSDLGTRALLQALEGELDKRPSREAQFRSVKEKSLADIQVVQPQMDYLNVIRDVLPRDGFFVEEVSQMGFTARFGFPVYEPRHYVTCGYQENLGFGFNTALGVKVAHPNKSVISVCGDGGFMYGVQELATAVQYGINVVTVVFNNSAYGNVLRDQNTKYGGRVIGSKLNNPNFVALAESFGAMGMKAENPAKLKTALEVAFAADVPVVIEVPVKQGSETTPWEFTLPPVPSE